MRRDWLGSIGLALVCAAAVVASFSTLASLAAVAGWGERASWLLPVCLDALGMTACRVWLSSSAPEPARRYARSITLVTVVLSILGNGAGHLASTGHLKSGLVLVVLVGSVPPAALAAGVELAVLRSAPVPTRQSRGKRDRSAVPVPAPAVPATDTKNQQPVTPVPAKSKPKTDKRRTDTELLTAARTADQAHRAEFAKPISRNRLRVELGIGQDKATTLVEQLEREEVAS